MRAAREKLSLALFLLTVGEAFSSTYQWPDQETGEAVTCQKCPPGTFVARHCTSRSGTECQTCPEQHYTSHQNYLQKCRYCNTICDDREQVKQECNATHNRVCECKPGYYRDDDACVKECTNYTDLDDPECDEAVIDFMGHQKITQSGFRRLVRTLHSPELTGRKPATNKKIRSVLRHLKRSDPDHALLPQLLEAARRARLPELESELRKRFLKQD